MKVPEIITKGAAFSLLNGDNTVNLALSLNSALGTTHTSYEWVLYYLFPSCVPGDLKEPYYTAMDELLFWFLQFQHSQDNNPEALEIINQTFNKIQHEKQ